MSKTEKCPLNKMTEGEWKMIKGLFGICALGEGGSLLCVTVRKGTPSAAVKSFMSHSLPPDQELRR